MQQSTLVPFTHVSDPAVKQGELKKRLLSTYEPSEIKSLIAQLGEKMDRLMITSLSEKVSFLLIFCLVTFSISVLLKLEGDAILQFPVCCPPAG